MITKLIKQLIYGVRREKQETFVDGFSTHLPEQYISFNDWCRELNVSSRVPKY